jgi:hypothetical protein
MKMLRFFGRAIAGCSARSTGGKFDGVYLGRHDDGKLVYAGKLEAGFSDDDKKLLLGRLKGAADKKAAGQSGSIISPRHGGSNRRRW